MNFMSNVFEPFQPNNPLKFKAVYILLCGLSCMMIHS